ncbi:uncharacterized protein Triagg1_117 [Trichoderma aggressivum f. europaeum]|uniref:Uncharacterized protein n=1 Tax=Trichoderma aggressivum f. europaeum TaxID=173218 RepID=A0AAE1ILQ0_9HYPO|nr:hypothetical protein Triagg1_117 [Trichoderma aggressivum f. europaeum]
MQFVGRYAALDLGGSFGRSALWREILQPPLLLAWGYDAAIHGSLTSSTGRRTLETKQTAWFGAYSTGQEPYSIPAKDKLSGVFSSPFLQDNLRRKQDPSLAFYGIHPLNPRSIAATYWEIATATNWENGAAK